MTDRDPLTVYGNSGSGNCLKIAYAAALLDIPYDWVEVDSIGGETRRPEFLARNPAGQVPVVRLPDGRHLAQSNAIILYLAEGSRLIPQDRFDRAKMMEWLFWEQYSHEPTIAVCRSDLLFRNRQPEPDRVEKGRQALALMEAKLSGPPAQPYLVGEALTIADICLVAYTRVAHEGGFDLAPLPALRGWIARVEADLGLPPA